MAELTVRGSLPKRVEVTRLGRSSSRGVRRPSYFTILMIRSMPSMEWLRPSWVSMKQTST
jgi:hypothetical protein